MYKRNNMKGKSKVPCLICAGEIDCRSKLLESVHAKKKYPTLEVAVQTTVRLYLESLHKLAKQFHLVFFVLSVTPPSNRKETQRACTVNLFNAAMKKAFDNFESDYIQYMDLYASLVSTDMREHLFLKSDYLCDGTHANSNIVPLVQKKLTEIFTYKNKNLFV